MRAGHVILAIVAVGLACLTTAVADTFGTGTNQFTMDFVTIAGDASSANGTFVDSPSSQQKAFRDPSHPYRVGVYEVTKAQYAKFEASLGVPVTGSPSQAYSSGPYQSGPNAPCSNISWFQMAQFVNWLNTSTGHHQAYKFTGIQGTSDYTIATWSPEEAAGGVNLHRHKGAFYFLPTEDEWVKAAYWNGTPSGIRNQGGGHDPPG